MTFLNPAYIAAMALIGIPLLIHLIRKRKLRVVKWAAMDFLRQSQRKQKRRLRIEELILLALRMLIVALAALAFARPVLRALGVPLLGQNARVYAVIVLDNSFSMGQRGPDNKTSWDRAQATSAEILTHVLKPGDSASLLVMSDQPTTLIGAPSFDLGLVARRIRAVTLSDRGTDYAATAREVETLLRTSKAPYKEVYWLTDDQASAWSNSKKETAQAAWSEIGKQARLTWVSVGAAPDRRANLAIHLPPPGRELVTPHLRARIDAEVSNYSAQTRNNMQVDLRIDGSSEGSQRVSLAPGARTVVTFRPFFPQAGTHIGSIELADPGHADALPHDNSAPFVVRSRDRIRVLVQDMHPDPNPAHSDSFYLLNALAPGGEAESIAPKLREGSSLNGVNLSNYETVILTGLTSLDSGDVRALADYVKAGGGLLLFPGDATDARRVNSDLGRAGLLPAQLSGRKDLSDAQALSLNPATITNHPALTMFKDTSVLNLGSAHFTRYETLEPVTDADAVGAIQVMIRYTSGQFGSATGTRGDPAFVERRVGLGRVIMAASSAGTNWNDLPVKSSYLPLIYQLVSYLGAGPNAHRNLRQDEPLFLTLPLSDANKPVSVTKPDGHVVSQSSVLDARGVTFRFTDTGQAGVYRIAVGGKPVDAFAVTLPDNESDLAAPLDLRQAITATGLPSSRLDIAHTPAELTASVNRSRYGAEIWRLFLWIVIVLLFCESLLAQRFGRRG